VAAPAREARAGRLGGLSTAGFGADYAEDPAHAIVGAGDEAIPGHPPVPQNLPQAGLTAPGNPEICR
jgi:hypothetical protein